FVAHLSTHCHACIEKNLGIALILEPMISKSKGNDTLVSVASVNVSASINGSAIECEDTAGSRQQITFNVKHSVPISYLHVVAVSSDTLLIIWTGADCIQSYDVFINGTNVNTTNGMSLLYNTGGAIGSIDVLVNSVDYYGRAVGNLSTQYQFNKYNFEVEAIISNSMSLVIIIKDKYINQQPALLSCELTVTNLTQSSMNCLHERLFIFTNVTEGDVYNYTVTITNVIGSTVKNGSIEIPYLPVEVCPSEVQYSPSTMIMSSVSSVLTFVLSRFFFIILTKFISNKKA
uniref:Fibronectin type-III domain-containing protein n=1 Tax=Amphimedon queenslandica TaxID=400682 RepID=A0A1X7TBP8_AMPQE